MAAIPYSNKPYAGLFGGTGATPSPTAPAPITPSTPAAAQPSTLDRALSILGSPGGAALVNAAGAGISAYGANKAAEADRNLSAQQFAARTAQDQLNADRQHQLAQTSAAVNASPLGEAQTFAQRNAMLLPLLMGARNVSVHPGDPAVAAAMGGGVQGGIRLPEGGLDPAMLQRMFGDASTMESIKNRQQMVGQLNPRGPAMDLGAMFGDKGTAASADVAAGNQMELQRQMDEEAKQRQLIQRAIDEDIRGTNQPGAGGQPPEGYEYDKKTGQLKKKGSSIWKKLGKIGLIAGGGALAATGFGGPAGAALIGAGIGAGNSALDGGGLKGAILGAGLGAATGGIGGGAAGAAKTGIGQALRTTVTNPNNLLRIGGTAVGGGVGNVANLAGQVGAGSLLTRRR
jgi:hypothetical protein